MQALADGENKKRNEDSRGGISMPAPPLLLLHRPTFSQCQSDRSPSALSRINPHFLFHLKRSVSLAASPHDRRRESLVGVGGVGTVSDTSSWQLGPARGGGEDACSFWGARGLNLQERKCLRYKHAGGATALSRKREDYGIWMTLGWQKTKELNQMIWVMSSGA